MKIPDIMLGCVLFVGASIAGVSAESLYVNGQEIIRYEQGLDWVKLVCDTEKRNSLVVRIKHVKADNVPATAVFLAIADKLGLAVGVENLPQQGRVPMVTLDATDMSAFAMLDLLHQASGAQYTMDFGGAGYVNYVHDRYATPCQPDPQHKFTPKEPLPSIFSPVVAQFTIIAKSPADAVRQLMDLEYVRNQPPALAISVQGGQDFIDIVRTSSHGVVTIPMSNPPVQTVRVRGALNMIALAAGKSWIADTYTEGQGKLRVRIRFFDKAAEVCPDAAKVVVELAAPAPAD